MTFFEFSGWTLLVALGLYSAVRIASAAFYKSKQDYLKRTQNGTQHTQDQQQQ